MKLLSDESGQTLIFVALGLAGLLGFVGLATDVSMMLHDKRIVQTAADTAAVAAATEYLYVNPATSAVRTAGQNATIADGITNGVDGATVTINPPPLYGPHAGTLGYVEAIVQKTDNRYLLGLVGGSTVAVSARAVAWTGAESNSCFDVLNGTASPGAHLQGSYTVGVPGCGMIVDSNQSNALEITGNGGSLTAGYIGVVGGISGNLPGGQTAQTGIVPVSDPLAGTLPVFTCTAAACTETLPNGNSAGPNIPCGGAPAGSAWGLSTTNGAVCYTGNITIPNGANLNSATYIFTGNVNLGGNTVTAANGITFYFTTGSLSMVGTPNITINSPGSGPFAGVAYVEGPSDATEMYINGDSSGLFNGIVYLPDAEMEISGNTNITLPQVIVNTFYDKGNATITITKTLPAGATPIKSVVLVE